MWIAKNTGGVKATGDTWQEAATAYAVMMAENGTSSLGILFPQGSKTPFSHYTVNAYGAVFNENMERIA